MIARQVFKQLLPLAGMPDAASSDFGGLRDEAIAAHHNPRSMG